MLVQAVRLTGFVTDLVRFDVLVHTACSGTRPIRLHAACGPDDDLSPCITIMLPGED